MYDKQYVCRRLVPKKHDLFKSFEIPPILTTFKSHS